ncbi:hypothetical protein LCGC14_0998720 [marine sediment metagenome]|uniref:Uncharacterized protein n=1 Tax=marine sediment metagenome TaxID=412755 RepID=A0A0F9N3P0_9ZZZZ
MKLALECRTNLLDHIQPFCDFDFILGHMVLEDDEYTAHYKESVKNKVVDNSVNEKGEPLSIAEMKEAFEKVEGTLVISPDWVGEAKKTYEIYEECVKEFGAPNVVGVLQGQTLDEVLSGLNFYQGMIAVPYDVLSEKTDPPWLMTLRRALVVAYIPQDRPVHLLGFTSLDEFDYYKNYPNITGIDTGAPVLLGLLGKDILDPLESKAEPTFNLMADKSLSQEQWVGVIRNIALLRRYIA